MRVLKVAVPAAIVLAGLAVSTVPSFGTPAFMAATKQKSCMVCHVKSLPKADMGKDANLTPTGKCFKAQADKTSLTDACKNAK